MEIMRGAFSEIETRTQAQPICRSPKISRGASGVGARARAFEADSKSASAGFICDFLLLYLTGRAIFDNRLGLLKKFDSARAAETLSAVKPQ
jgi:hypothetical protein